MSRKKTWFGSKPEKCDLCGMKIEDEFYDVSVPELGGSWAMLCRNCFGHKRCRLGTGHGQHYAKQTKIEWVKIGG